MNKAHLYQPFEISLSEVMDQCRRPLHSHSFFELVHVVSGTGQHIVNESKVDFKPGHLFLLTPEDTHHFDIHTPAQFLFIRFNEEYVHSNKLESDTRQGIAYILRNATHDPSCVMKDVEDRTVIRSLVSAIIREHNQRGLYHNELLLRFINTILIIIARNIAARMPDKINEATEERALEILQYVQTNITDPAKIRAKTISRHFGISEHYLGKYFKKHTNENLQNYIIRYKLQIAESKLLHSNMRLKEIADQLGFTDKSHLNRLFKKYYTLSPVEYRKKQQTLPV